MTAAKVKMNILNPKSKCRINEKQGLDHLTAFFCILKDIA